MSGGSLDYVSTRIDEAAVRIQRELAEIKLRYEHGKYLEVCDYDRDEWKNPPEFKDAKIFTEAIIKQLHNALVCVRNAATYCYEIEWWTSGDTSAADFLMRSRNGVKGNKESRGVV